jgi:hypothetical protein
MVGLLLTVTLHAENVVVCETLSGSLTAECRAHTGIHRPPVADIVQRGALFNSV